MAKYSQVTYQNFKTAFENVAKKVANYAPDKRELPADEAEREKRIEQYKNELIVSYNGFVQYVSEVISNLNIKSKDIVRNQTSTYKAKLLNALAILNLAVEIPENFGLIDISRVESLDTFGKDREDHNGSFIFQRTSDTASNGKENANAQVIEDETINVQAQEISQETDQIDNIVNNSENLIDIEVNMPQSTLDFLNIATKILNYKYDGDPLSLRTFLNKIELLELATEEQNVPHLRKYVVSCLEGKALESIPENPNTLQDVTDALKGKIKYDSSKVIEGRLLALKADHAKLNDYAKRAEELSEQFQRALVLEGFPKIKANEMAIEKTIELCRSNARSDLVRSILESAHFEDSKEVVAKYIIQSRKETTEKQILFYKTQNSRRGNKQNYSQNSRYENNGQNGNDRGRGRGQGRGQGRGRGYGRGYGRGRGRNVYAINEQPENGQAPPPGAQNAQTVRANQAE